MSKYRKSKIFAACLSFSIVPAAAQTRDNALRNMNTVAVLVESVNADSKICELDGELIARSIKYPFSSAMFKTVDAESDTDAAKLRGIIKDEQSRFAAIIASEQRGDTTPENAAKQMQAASDEYDKKFADIQPALIFYVNVLSLYSNATNLCVSNIDAEAYLTQKLNLEPAKTSIFAQVRLWNAGTIIGSDRKQHRQLLSQRIEELAKQFVTAWNLDNKRGEYDDIPKQVDVPEGYVAGPAPLAAPKPDARPSR
jgi:hypothetical protein